MDWKTWFFQGTQTFPAAWYQGFTHSQPHGSLTFCLRLSFLLAYPPAFSIGLEEAVWTPQASTLSVFSALRSSVSASRPLFPSSLPIPVAERNTKVQEPGVGLCQGSCLGICDKAEQDQKLPSLGTESCKPGMWIPFFVNRKTLEVL